VASQLYAELLQGGYTHVCEFHYLQHDRDGRPYPDPLELSWALADAAADTGIGLTLLPVLYQRAGFNAPRLRDDQRRFATDAAAVLSLQRGAAASGRARVNAGVAIHSLRAADPAAMGIPFLIKSDAACLPTCSAQAPGWNTSPTCSKALDTPFLLGSKKSNIPIPCIFIW
jgi:formimidoylglutamate deiminase